MENDVMITELLNTWEETYKKGQLTFWVFLSLKESNKCVEEIKEFVEKMSEGSMTDAERVAYEKVFDYKVVAPDSEMSRMIEDENKRRRPELYK